VVDNAGFGLLGDAEAAMEDGEEGGWWRRMFGGVWMFA
jgi:hypothetical protein